MFWMVLQRHRKKRPGAAQTEKAFKINSGAPRPMKMGTIASPWRYDFIARGARLNREINAGLANPAIQASLADLTATPLIFTPAALSAYLATEMEKWGKVVNFHRRQAGLSRSRSAGSTRWQRCDRPGFGKLAV